MRALEADKLTEEVEEHEPGDKLAKGAKLRGILNPKT